ncbi:MAG: hypothetical protein MZV64_61885 [Ignavibacteriales bacterium]|nr:hypothetical protein [Ignavibacteriales bacterium]
MYQAAKDLEFEKSCRHKR